MTDPNPAQEPVDIKYESSEGAKYSEVHGDPEQNLEVKSVAEQKSAMQPNVTGTTPDPHKPELTDDEKQRRADIEHATSPDSEKQGSKSGNKQRDASENK